MHWALKIVYTEGPCLMRLLGLEKSRIIAKFRISQMSVLQFALCEFWATVKSRVLMRVTN